MASVMTGTPSVNGWRIRAEVEWVPRYGWTSVETWQGTKAQMEILYNALVFNGYRVKISNNGPLYTLIVNLGIPPDEVPLVRFVIRCQQAQVNVWQAPAVQNQLFTYGNPADIRKQIQDAVTKGLAAPGAIAGDAILLDVYDYLVRGGTSYELKRCMLTRSRTYSIAWVARTVLDQVQKVYTTAALVRVFGIPAITAIQLPADPTTAPMGTAWSWKSEDDTVEEIPQLYKVNESQTWVFDAWSTTRYQLVT